MGVGPEQQTSCDNTGNSGEQGRWKVNTSSCYRTGGSVKVPAQVKEKVKRRIKLNRYKEQEVEIMQIELVSHIPEFEISDCVMLDQVSEVGVSCTLSSYSTVTDVRTCSPPPPPPRK